MPSKLDSDIQTCLSTLYSLQSDIGADNSKSKNKLGSNGKTDRFMDLKGGMVESLVTLKDLMKAAREADKTASNPKEVIQQQSVIRENIRQLQENWRELNSIYEREAKKKRSKFSKVRVCTHCTLAPPARLPDAV